MRIAAAGLLVSLSLSADALRPGEVVPRVACAASPSHSYALYLPKRYTSDRKWPVLYLLDTGGRALVPLERFRGAAEEHGFVLASSYDTRSDHEMDPSLAAVQAMLADTRGRLSLDERLTHLAGFSGTARMATLIGLKGKVPIAGVVGCGAGYLDGFPPEKGQRFVWFGTVGDEDFNYVEMKLLERRLTDKGIPHGLALFHGPHQWPPEAEAAEALDFLVLHDAVRGLLPPDEERSRRLVARRLDAARAAEEAGDRLGALRRYEAAARDLEGAASPADLAAAVARRDALRKDPDVKRLLREDEKRDDRDFQVMGRLEGILRDGLAAEPPIAARLVADLGIARFLKTAGGDPSPDERLAAKRILNALYTRTGFYVANEERAAGRPARAALALTVATEIRPKEPAALYDLACAQAVSGETKKALESLRRALDAGFRPLSHLESDPDLASLRGLDAYREIVAGAGAPASR